MNNINSSLDEVLNKYKESFVNKTHNKENEDHDPLMDAFGITPDLKRENRQYWGRELGMCWQILVTELCNLKRDDFKLPQRFGADEPYDLSVGDLAIDTKYRIGSGDSGTLKKFKQYGPMLEKHNFKPTLLIIRTDNLPAAITACTVGRWNIKTGNDTFNFIHDLTGFDMLRYLQNNKGNFSF